MANGEDQPSQEAPPANDPQNANSSESESESESDYDSDYSYDEEEDESFRRALAGDEDDEDSGEAREDKRNNPETNLREFSRALDSAGAKELHDELDPLIVEERNPFDFPEDPENWSEHDLRELWADPINEISGTGWDPAFATEEEYEHVNEMLADGDDPPIAPFYLPFRKHYPPIPDNHYDIATPKDTIEELDRIEEFLRWVSYVFQDGSTYVYRSVL